MGRRLREGVCVCVCQRKGVLVWLLWRIRKGGVCVCVCVCVCIIKSRVELHRYKASPLFFILTDVC